MNGTTPSLAYLLHDTSRALRRRFEVRMSGHSLSSAQWRLLVLACKYPSTSQGSFAEKLEIEPISVSRLIDRMVKGGWLQRQDDPKDRRVKLVLPTEKALSVFREITDIADDVYREALAGLSDAEAEALLQGLACISKNLTALETAAAGIQPAGDPAPASEAPAPDASAADTA